MQPHELKELLKRGEAVTLLDVREQEEIMSGEGMIEGAQNMPMGKVFIEATKGTLPMDRKIVTICKSGRRCEIVARELKQKGYDIEHLEGGMDGWKKEQE